jgi:hypothetical protein
MYTGENPQILGITFSEIVGYIIALLKKLQPEASLMSNILYVYHIKCLEDGERDVI